MYANRPDDFYERYAAALEGHKQTSTPGLDRRLSDAYNSVYRLVAFDIDGTLTSPTSPEITDDSARLIGSLVSRGVEVVLVTGRGRSATRAAADDIVLRAGVQRRHFQRLSAITSNGLYLLESGPEEDLLGRETQLHEGLDLAFVSKAARNALDSQNITYSLQEHPSTTDIGRGAVRIDLESEADQTRAVEAVTAATSGETVVISTGRYATTHTIDLTSTDKAEAISTLAVQRGIDDTMILRVGDRGDTGENDWAMLASPAGFTVGSCSQDDTGCWPVLDEEFQLLRGLDATRALLDGVLLFAPLSLAPEDPAQVLQDLLRVEGLLRRRARSARLEVTKRLQLAASRYSAEPEVSPSNALIPELSDLFDPWSGAVRLRDWELTNIPPQARALFEMPSHEVPPPQEEPVHSWSMWTDTGLLLRGPRYYVGLTDKRMTFGDVADAHAEFLMAGADLLRYLGAQPFSLLNWKIILGIADYARNLALVALVSSFTAEDRAGAVASQAVLVELADKHSALLTGSDQTWPKAVGQLADVVSDVAELAQTSSIQAREQRLYRYRECDCFIENLVAAEVALKELRTSQAWPSERPVLAVGIANGGAEIPSLLTAVARRGGDRVIGSLLRLSTYGEAELDRGEQIRRGDAEYVRRLRDEPARFMILTDEGTESDAHPAILCDDNVTTAISLQHARDVMLLRGHAVLGAAVVRYPSANRAVHMALPSHGFPDPAALAGFIRGLMAPSPYTRLLVPDPTPGSNQYRDRRGRFNKAKERLERLLGMPDENGSEHEPDLGEPT